MVGWNEILITAAGAAVGLCGTFVAALFTFLGIVYTTAQSRNKNHAEMLNYISEAGLNKARVEDIMSNRIMAYANELEEQLKALKSEVHILRVEYDAMQKAYAELKRTAEKLQEENAVLKARIAELEKIKGPN